jgi:hypothetical protein
MSSVNQTSRRALLAGAPAAALTAGSTATGAVLGIARAAGAPRRL